MPQVRQKYKVRHDECALHPEKEWRWIAGYEGRYEVSSCGDVRSYQHGRKVYVEPYLIRIKKNWAGYPMAHLWMQKRVKVTAVHRLVLIAFHGPPPPGVEAAHFDGTRDNNHVENLLWVTHAENLAHKWIHGTARSLTASGSLHWRAKLTEALVFEIRQAVANGEPRAAVARRYGISSGHIGHILNRSTWRHVE